MKPPISLIEVIEDAVKYNSCIRIAKDIREAGFTGTIIMEKS